MPVGCLGGGGGGGGSASNNSSNGGGHHGGHHAKPMDVIVTSTILNAADQFAFMQQTLLMQIFRLNHCTPPPDGSING